MAQRDHRRPFQPELWNRCQHLIMAHLGIRTNVIRRSLEASFGYEGILFRSRFQEAKHG
jgi:hypothetical protein